MKKLYCAFFVLCFFVTSAAWAQGSFVVKNIRFEGLQRITEGTALSYLPIKVGDSLEPGETATIIRALYRTGFFQNVSLAREGNTLIIRVVERPTIGSINISGNKIIPTKKLKPALDRVGISVGQTFNSAMLEQVKQALLQEYYARGNYSAKIETTVTPESRNRVDLSINIVEGQAAKIRQIKIIGNKAFSDKTLLKQFVLTSPTLFTWITGNDKYSKEKLDGDLQRLRSFYMDHGYIKFKIDSTQVSITPDKEDVYIIIRVTEGPQYKFSGFSLQGKTILPPKELGKVIKIKAGDVFSRDTVVQSEKAIGEKLGDMGYLFVLVKPIPEIDDKDRTVFITFNVQPGHRVYVNRISFTGNTKTSDMVLRRAMRQDEGGLASLSNIKESERQLKLLPYLKNVSVKTTVTPGTQDQVDVDYNMTERESAELSLSLGFSDTYGLLYGAGINQSNFLGSGRAVGINFSKDEYEQNISFTYNNPYYTQSGIQRGFNVYSQKFEPGQVNIANYETEQNGFQVRYVIPFSENSSVQIGGGFQNLDVDEGNDPSFQVRQYLNANGHVFNQILFNAGWSFNGYDQTIFPTKGFSQSVDGTVSLPSGRNNLEYWDVGYEAHLYQPLVTSRRWILSLRGAYDHGDSFGNTQGFPFFENYYAGGIGTVRGFEGNTMGPTDSQGNALGGSTLMDGTVALILPPMIENIRTSAFIDAGNVFAGSPTLNQVRVSAGIGVIWRVPMLGPMQFSLAYPLNKKSGDHVEPFQFNVGTTF